MLTRYFARTDLEIGGDALFGFVVGLVVVVSASAARIDLGDLRLVVRLGAGAMLLATFMAGVAIGRSVSRALG